jgi:hypothetical protein
MKKLILVISFFVFKSTLFGQLNLEAQIGGSNFLGFSINTEVDIPLFKNKNYALSPSFGLGLIRIPHLANATIIHSGLHLKYRKWGIGTEVSHFSGDFVELLVYPNVNYTFGIRSNWYLKASVGAFIPFAYMNKSDKGASDLRFAGDIIPGAGINFGYRFR